MKIPPELIPIFNNYLYANYEPRDDWYIPAKEIYQHLLLWLKK